MSPFAEGLKELLLQVWSYAPVKILVSHIIVNLVVALAAAQKTGELQLAKIGEFLVKKILPYVSVFFVVQLFGEEIGLAWLGPAAWAMLESSLVGDLTDNLAKLGIKWPEKLVTLLTKGGKTWTSGYAFVPNAGQVPIHHTISDESSSPGISPRI